MVSSDHFLGDHAVLQVRDRHPPLCDGAEPHSHRAHHRQLGRRHPLPLQVQRVRVAPRGSHELREGTD